MDLTCNNTGSHWPRAQYVDQNVGLTSLKPVVRNPQCNQYHLEGLLKQECWVPLPEILDLGGWSGARAQAFLTSSQVMLILLV